MKPGDELVDITNDDGHVVGQVSRREMRTRRLPHRATFVVQVLVDSLPHAVAAPTDQQVETWFDAVEWNGGLTIYDGPGAGLGQMPSVGPESTVVVHQRADWKDLNPSYWDLAFGGVCDAGELWLPSARRELAEEAGLIDVSLLPLGAGRFSDDHGTVFGGLFLAPTTRLPMPNDGEVVAVEFVAIADVANWCRRHEVCEDSLTFIPPLLDHLIQMTG